MLDLRLGAIKGVDPIRALREGGCLPPAVVVPAEANLGGSGEASCSALASALILPGSFTECLPLRPFKAESGKESIESNPRRAKGDFNEAARPLDIQRTYG